MGDLGVPYVVIYREMGGLWWSTNVFPKRAARLSSTCEPPRWTMTRPLLDPGVPAKIRPVAADDAADAYASHKH